MTDADIVDSSMLGGLQPIRLPRARHDRAQRAWWEAGRLCALRSLLTPGDVLVDVGAEAGDMSALYALWGARVVAVEPNWLAWPSIRACFEANRVAPYATFEGFLADATDSSWNVRFGGWPPTSEDDYTAAHDFRTLAEYPDLPRTTVDHLAGVLGAPVRHLCIDVEGAEGRVLAGAASVLAEDRPYVWLSLHPDEWLAVYGDSEQTIRQLAKDAEYEWVPISADPHERHVLLCPDERFWGW